MTTLIDSETPPSALHIAVDVTLDSEVLRAAMAVQPNLSLQALRQAMEEDVTDFVNEKGYSLEQAVAQAKEKAHAALREIVYATDAPWEDDEPMREALESAGWRYAALIGITDSQEGPEVLAADLGKYPHFVKKADDGTAIWDENDAIQFVQDLTGQPAEVCKRWLAYDWPC